MKWRCAYCGKPHERNDPPCDNCGHSEFEKAVVPMAPEAEDEEAATTYVWVCTECGNDHPKNTPPCDRCGAAPLERREQSFDEQAVVEEMLGESESERGSTAADVGYLDVLDAKLVLGFVGVGALLTVLVLGFLGVVSIPGITPPGPVPGNATSVDGLSLSGVEAAYVEGLNERRPAAGYDELTRDDDLASAAAYVNRERVRAAYADGDGPTGERFREELGDSCGEAGPSATAFEMPSNLGTGGEPEYDSEAELARALLDSRSSEFQSGERGLIGVDVHVAPDGRVYVAQVVC